MRLILLDENQRVRPVGAAVIHPSPDGGVLVELGPADGAPILRLVLTRSEALRLSEFVRFVADGDDEAIILAEE